MNKYLIQSILLVWMALSPRVGAILPFVFAYEHDILTLRGVVAGFTIHYILWTMVYFEYMKEQVDIHLN